MTDLRTQGEREAMRRRPGLWFAFCETMAATGPWHLREPIRGGGLKYGGGADTPTLCGLQPSWDVRSDVTHEAIMNRREGPGRTCARCRAEYEKRIEP